MMRKESLPMIFPQFAARLSAVAKAGRLLAALGVGVLGAGLAAPVLAPSAAMAQGASGAAAAQQIADHFSAVRTMTGEFVQFGPRGEQTGGTFYLQRPGKVRFDYKASWTHGISIPCPRHRSSSCWRTRSILAAAASRASSWSRMRRRW